MSNTTKDLYTSLSENVQQVAVETGLLEWQNKTVEDFVKETADRSVDVDELSKHIIYLESKLPPGRKLPRNKKTLTATDKRQLKLFIPQNSEKKYSLYMPLHKLWLDYMESLYSNKRLIHENKKQLGVSLLKADYHGSILNVLKSKCPSYVGVSGIMIKETKNTFTLITKEDKMKVIPKQNSIFGFQFNGFMFTIYGNHFRIKSSERTSRKFKNKSTIDL